jgi:hypothetical protein
MKVRGLTPAEVEVRRQTEPRHNLRRNLIPGVGKRLWTAAELALRGTLPDGIVAEKLARTHNAVRLKRENLGIPNPEDRRPDRGSGMRP